MFARVLAVLVLLQAVAMVAPPQSWPWWMVHFAAIEGCLFGALLGLLAIYVTEERWVTVAATTGMVVCLLPGLLSIAPYIQEDQRFSVWSWFTGGSVPVVAVERDVALGTTVSADIWRGHGEGPRPAVLVVHGGSWRSGDKGEVPHVSAYLASAGFTVVDVRYRLAGEAPFPAAIEDVRCALAAVVAGAERFGIDPERLALLGRSAGGQIALTAAYADDSIRSSCGGTTPPVRAVVSVYGVTDVAWAHDHPYVPDVVDGVAATEFYLGGPPDSAGTRYRDASPGHWIAGQPLPATLLIHGTGERCVRPENTTFLREQLRDAGARQRTVLIPMADHGFDVRRGGIGEQLARGVILDFLRAELSAAGPRPSGPGTP
ncbi:hypothetical protein LBMAG42_15500 [Deltaproteobacteria bacterium]|nr:hypothetical protein LBMAG42_15500 [Deltaproteobacteria bacterium]